MKTKLERTTKKERIALKHAVDNLIEDRQELMDNRVNQFKDQFPNIRKISQLNYNPSNLFKELGIFNLYAFYCNAISDRDIYHVKNENYYKLVKALEI